jgi:hypothetical protein
MTDTTTPSLATHVPMWRRRLLATALIIGAGMAVGVGTTALTSDGVRRGDLSAGDTKDHPNYGPIDTATTTTWTGDAKDHPNYGPVDTAAGTGDAKDHPNYGPAAPARLFPCIDEDSLRPLTLVTAQATGVVANVTSPGPGPGRS